MRTIRCLLALLCVDLGGCVFGYYAPAPDGFHGDFVLKSAAQLGTCDIGPGMWSGSTPAPCLLFACSENCVPLPAGTPITVLHTFVDANGTRDVTMRIGGAGGGKTAHAFGTWDQVQQILLRR